MKLYMNCTCSTFIEFMILCVSLHINKLLIREVCRLSYFNVRLSWCYTAAEQEKPRKCFVSLQLLGRLDLFIFRICILSIIWVTLLCILSLCQDISQEGAESIYTRETLSLFCFSTNQALQWFWQAAEVKLNSQSQLNLIWRPAHIS